MPWLSPPATPSRSPALSLPTGTTRLPVGRMGHGQSCHVGARREAARAGKSLQSICCATACWRAGTSLGVPRARPACPSGIVHGSWQDQGISAPVPTHPDANPGNQPLQGTGLCRRGRRQRVSRWHRTWRDEAGQEDEPPRQVHGSTPGTAGDPWGQRQGRLTPRGWEVAGLRGRRSAEGTLTTRRGGQRP